MTERTYVDVSADDFGSDVKALLDAQRELYAQEKALKARIIKAMNEAVQFEGGLVVGAIGWTRWGQLQVALQEPVQPKAAKQRASLADFIAARQANGSAV